MYSRRARRVGIARDPNLRLRPSSIDPRMVILTVVLVGAVGGALAYAAARRWPDVVEAPHVPAQTVAASVEERPGLARRLRKSRTDPTKLTGLALTVALTLIVGGAVGIGLLLAMIHGHTGLAHWDLTFADFGAHHATPASTTFLRDVSQVGGTLGAIGLGLVVAAIELRRMRTWAVVGFLFMVIAG